MTVAIQEGFLSGVRDLFERMPVLTADAAAGALNTVASRSGMVKIRKDMEAQIAFPSGYLDQENRLFVSRYATPDNLEVVITGRDQPTSLARFAPGQDSVSARGKKIVVRVKRGGAVQVLRRAFLVNLRNGGNGLAIRLKDGEKPTGTTKAVMLDNNVYLLYGPSVDQVLGTLADLELPALGEMVAKEFDRQFTWKGLK